MELYDLIPQFSIVGRLGGWRYHGKRSFLAAKERLYCLYQCGWTRNFMKEVLWCHASSIALRVAREVKSVTTEKAAWQRIKDDFVHIHEAKLKAMIIGINLSLKGKKQETEVKNSSITVASWVESELLEERTKRAVKMLIMRRLGTLRQLIKVFDLQA